MPSGSLNLFRLGARGVNVVTAPTHLTDDELTSAQNAEVVSVGGECAIDQRPGMTRINATALTGSVVVAHDVLSEFLTDKTPYLYAGMYTGSTHTWRRSSDGTTWANVDAPVKPSSNNANITGFFKRSPKAVTLGKSMYYVDGATPIGLHSYDGTTDATVSTVPPAVAGAVLTTPSAPGINAGGTQGITSYTYKIVAVAGSTFHSAASAAGTTPAGNATQSADNYNYIQLQTPGAGVQSYDVYRTAGGLSQGKIGTVPVVAGVATRDNGSGVALLAQTPPSVSPQGVTGSTSYRYEIVMHAYGATSASSGSFSLPNNGNAVLSGSNFNRISWSPTGALAWTSFDVYRTVGGATQGKIGTVASPTVLLNDTGLVGDGTTPPAASSGSTLISNIFPGAVINFVDAGLVGDATTPPATAAGATAGDALGVMDLITDGVSLYAAVLDQASSDPTVYGRVLSYNPVSTLWTQLGAFLTASGNGTASALAFFDGALSYGTFIGIASGNTSYLTSLAIPLASGGISDIRTTAVSQSTCALTVFNGDVYAGYVSLVAGTAAIVAKRAAVATWTTARTGPATAQFNAYTSLYVFNGYLFAGWTSGGGATAARIESTPDGTTWTSEIALDAAEVVCQMTTFGGNLYVVLGKTGVAYNTKSRILKRTVGGVWTTVDDPADDFAGCLAVVYQ